MKKRVALPFLLLFLPLAASISQANLIQNGSFEEGPTLQRLGEVDSLFWVGNTEITGWEIGTPAWSRSHGSINIMEYPGYLTWTPSDGVRSVDLNGSSPGGIYQFLNTEIGNTYKLEFDLAGNPEWPPAVKGVRVAVASTTVLLDTIISFDTTGKSLTNMGWEHKTLTFVADEDLIVLVFISQTDGVGGPTLDDVQVTLVASESGGGGGCSIATLRPQPAPYTFSGTVALLVAPVMYLFLRSCRRNRFM
ncbi:MAG: choice-of-anchor C family protein [Candidatus Deferrimicrobiaceae bacterium]